MSLMVPMADELAAHLRVSESELIAEYTEPAVEEALQLATDLMELASGVTEQPARGTLKARMANVGILAMAHYLLINFDDREAIYSPFSSERIGSYSYSKQQAAAAGGEATDVPLFNLAVEALVEVSNQIGTDSTEVFDPDHDFFSVPKVYYDPFGAN